MKEKLTELIKQAKYCTAEELAEYLIEAGLVLPVRCKDCDFGEYAGLGKVVCDLHGIVEKGCFYCGSGFKDNERKAD